MGRSRQAGGVVTYTAEGRRSLRQAAAPTRGELLNGGDRLGPEIDAKKNNCTLESLARESFFSHNRRTKVKRKYF